MIVHTKTMREIEEHSPFSESKLMELAGKSVAQALSSYLPKDAKVLILCGKGNNGGDGFVAYQYLKDYKCKIYLVEGTPNTTTAKTKYNKLPKEAFITLNTLKRNLKSYDCILDCVYGIGFVGNLNEPVRKLFRLINQSNISIYSVDINSGCEADTGRCCNDALHSKVTFVLDCYKPFHMLGKNHGMFQKLELLSLGLPHDVTTTILEMSEDCFLQHFPHKPVKAHKNTYGHTLLIGGSYGMAGALGLNILGAKTMGSSYIDVLLPEEIYPILASRFLSPVYHPFAAHTFSEVIERVLPHAKAVGFGSGAVYFPHKVDCMDYLIQHSTVPMVFDAEVFSLLHQNMYVLRFAKAPIILTPHIKEFASLLNKQPQEILDDPIRYVSSFAKDYHTIVVLKGPNTIIASPCGKLYINQSGNQGLAQAGSGDLLTGIMTTLLTYHCDALEAACMAVWIHGKLADIGIQNHSMFTLDLNEFPQYMNDFLKLHNR